MRAPQFSDGTVGAPDGGTTTPDFVDAAHRVSGRVKIVCERVVMLATRTVPGPSFCMGVTTPDPQLTVSWRVVSCPTPG
jgi:hypothetical protein